jgi:ubiquinone/menaquinone biosynthesis C-methylase UbiE
MDLSKGSGVFGTDAASAARVPEATATVASRWGGTAVARTTAPLQGWLDSRMVLREYVQPKQTGASDKSWLGGLVEHLGIPPTGRWLSLGCGGADTEIFAARRGFFASMLALDVAGQAIEVAVEAAAAKGITSIEFGVADFNCLELPEAAFDVVLMTMSLHHVARLEEVMRAVESALRPGGYFLINEFVGSRQFQFSDLQLEVVNALLAALPERLRQDSATGELKTSYACRSVEEWNQCDPSEAVRSDEIVPLLHRYFEVVLRRDYGGTVLNLVLEHIIHNFDHDNPDDLACFRLLAATEELLIRSGVLASDFTVMAMRKPRWGRRLVAAIEDVLVRNGLLARDFTVMNPRAPRWYRRLRRLLERLGRPRSGIGPGRRS